MWNTKYVFFLLSFFFCVCVKRRRDSDRSLLNLFYWTEQHSCLFTRFFFHEIEPQIRNLINSPQFLVFLYKKDISVYVSQPCPSSNHASNNILLKCKEKIFLSKFYTISIFASQSSTKNHYSKNENKILWKYTIYYCRCLGRS